MGKSLSFSLSQECWAAKISPIGPEAAEIVALLRGLSMNPNAVLVRHPHFFSMKGMNFHNNYYYLHVCVIVLSIRTLWRAQQAALNRKKSCKHCVVGVSLHACKVCMSLIWGLNLCCIVMYTVNCPL